MKILLIEDDLPTMELMKLRIEHLGCRVLVASTADEGIHLARSEHPNLILADLKLGGGLAEGLEFVAALGRDPQLSDIPLYIHSVYVAHETDLGEWQERVDGYLIKPLKVKDLQKLIAEHAVS